MKLTAVSVEGCGRFGTPTVLEGLGPGVNILCARNEAGKSTLFRAIRTCLFERHSSRNRDIAALATEGLSIPVSIAVGFDHNGQSYEIRKSFLKSVSASLKRGGVEIARNAEADELVWDLLGLAPKSSKSFDDATYGVLWVEQGQSFLIPEPSEGAATALNDVIQQEVGTLVGGERARSLLSHVKEELGRYLTDTGRVKTNGPLDAAEKHSAALTADRLEVEERLAMLDRSIDELNGLRAELKRAADPAEAQRLKRELDEAKQSLIAAEEAARLIQQLEADERQAQERLAAQNDKLKQLKARAAAIDENRLRIKSLSAELAPLSEQEAEASRIIAEQRQRKAALEQDLDALDAEDRQLQRLAAAAQKASTRDALAARLENLKDFAQRLSANEAALKARTVDEAAVKSLDALEREAELIRAKREASAARLTIELKGASPVKVNGAAIEGHTARAVTEPLTIEVGSDVAITVSPPPSSAQSAEAEQQANREKLKALLARHGASGAQDLQRLRQERMALEDEERNLRAARAALALGKASPLEIIQTLSSEISTIDSEAKKLLADIGSTALPSSAELEARREALQERRGALREAGSQCQGIIDSRSDEKDRIGRHQSDLSGRQREIDGQLRGDLALLPDDRRDALVSVCEKEREARASDHRGKAALLAEKRAAAPQAGEVERLRTRVERLSAAQQNAANQIDELRRRIARLEGQIETAGGDGLGERAADLKEQQEQALKEHARIEERVEVLKRLRFAVEQSYAKRREQLNAPLRRHLKPFLNDVFPQAEIDLGENFAIAGLKRSGPASELFGRLSHGTQEQIAVLVRLAMGAMICEKGPAVPVILDDALVFSDDSRIQQMFDAIHRAGRNQQVIVLTCRESSFRSLGGKTLHISGR